jgi:hypothetical protein
MNQTTNPSRPTLLQSRRRRGGVMLLCMLAAVVLATAVLGMAQSHRHRIKRIESRRATIQSTQALSGLYERAIAVIQNNPTFSGRLDPAITSSLGSYALVQPMTATQTLVEVYAYDTAATPAIRVVIDPASL